MIRSILQIGGRKPVHDGTNARRAGRVVCDGIVSNWGEVLNASSTGARLLAGRKEIVPESGQSGTLIIKGPDGPFRLVGRVVWCRKQNWGRRELGVQFIDVPVEARYHLLRLAEMAVRTPMMDTLTPDGFVKHG